jgi:hypothetical protein
VVPLEVPGNGETLPDVRRSDHASFWDHGYEALLITDTGNFRNHNYHLPSDTLGTLDLGFAASVANASAAAVAQSLTADVCGSSAPVGGIAESPEPEPASASGGRGLFAPSAFALGGLAAAGGALLLIGVGWRARRRWLR